MAKTQLMAILNTTPDSFYEKSRATSFESAVVRGQQIYMEGADILDIGGESTRPKNIYIQEGEIPLTAQAEIERVIPVIRELSKLIPIPISIDTRKPEVAAQAIEAGAKWINDVGGFQIPEMRAIAASSKAQICVMHMQGNPDTMQVNPMYEKSIIEHLKHWFSNTLELLIRDGVRESQIVLDPGIGFGKTVDHNLEIIHNLRELKSLGFPILLGISRKLFMHRILNKPPEALLSATLAMNSVAILSDVEFIRVHDVKEHRDIIDVLDAYKKSTS